MHSRKDTTIIGHVNELRQRLLICAAAVALCSGVFLVWSDPVYEFFVRPSRGIIASFYFVSPLTAFCVRMMMAVVAGCVCALPVVLHQAWIFIAPGLEPDERRIVLRAFTGGVVLFTAGMAVCYYAVIPIALRFLMGYQVPALVPMITINEYVSFVMMMIVTFGCMFVLPLALWALACVGILDPAQLVRKRGAIVIGIFVVAAIVTPPDPVSQLLVALPVWALFEMVAVIIKK